ncbi:HECT domain protein [Aspergillus ruber CBS 135680]|uniref:HECT-type E3 ubiquitin transferase n=1 Tax=Aspergillus ruber (strain CBS 135680) TaxID=1388766 RepID=A0A017SEM3_ASPRC|nr:HECT domain protein [Aspergillus ruber CBS 135680]EYE95231.1 HECT domain protein [Aspergillus ruber CBS 135680]
MTRLRGASVSSPDISRDSPQFYRSKLPPNTPEIIVQNTVEVSHPSQVLPWYRDDRRRQFHLLVRRYKNQVLYGCQDPNCLTPTCASYRRRVTEGPFRRYTELSARTLACYLASLDNAENGLCRNSLRSSWDSSHDAPRRSRRRSRGLAEHDQTTKHGNSMAQQGSASTEIAQTNSNIQRSTGQYTATHKLKDPKSLTQNLFDTLPLRMVEWLPLRRPHDSFDSRPDQIPIQPAPHSPKLDNHPSKPDSRKDERPPSRRYSGTPSGNYRAYSPRTPSRQSAAVEVKLPNQHVKRLSLTESDQWCQGPRSSFEEKVHPERKPTKKLSINAHATTNEFTPPALKHRPQKHRGRTGDVNSIKPLERQKKERRVSWDGSKVLNDVQNIENRQPPAVPSETPIEIQSPSDRKPKRKPQPCRKETVPTVQTVTHLSKEIVDGLGQVMIQSEEEAQRWKEELEYMELTGNYDGSEWFSATPRQQQAFSFVAQSVFYSLSSPRQILRCFRQGTNSNSNGNDKSSRLDFQEIQSSLRKLTTICPWDMVLHSLWDAVEKLFVPPKELPMSGRHSRRSSATSSIAAPLSAPILARQTSDSIQEEHVTDANAAHIVTIALFALAGSVPEVDAPTWRGILRMRAIGTVAPDAEMRNLPSSSAELVTEVTDKFEHGLALRLANRLVRALTARLAFHEISKARDYTFSLKSNVLDLIVDNLSEQYLTTCPNNQEYGEAPTNHHPGAPAIITEWLRTLLLREWDGNPRIPRSSTVGGAVQILSTLYKERNRLGLVPEDFHTPFFAERLDPLEMPVEWLGTMSNNNKTMHLLSHSFLFPPPALVIYFRALNYSVMSKYYESAMTTTRHVTQTAFGAIHVNDDVSLLSRMKTSMSTYLVLVVRRDNVVTDALNQLWRREKRELMRPLKVQMGMDEGEEGLDHGGVQQEFFRVLMAEALHPSYGMFTVDPRTRISWFQPCSLEPLYKFELLGLLLSLAVYNGLTLPVNFPIAFYRKLLGLKVKRLDQIQDGWLELAKGLEGLLTWQDGDVADIFMRTYEFSFEAFGRVETVDMQRVDRDAMWPLPSRSMPVDGKYSTAWSDIPHYGDRANLSPPSSMAAEATELMSCESSHGDFAKSMEGSISIQSPTPPAEEACLVTNRNRHEFVKDYIFWLTDKSVRPQYEAFARGFYTCLDRSALSIFTPEALKTVVEGIQEIDVKELERHARYEGGFGPSHPVVRDFWSIAQRFSAEKKAQLLEFVTASDRVPVNGIASIMFVIQKNGVGDARLPTSLTCFGRLLLPEYSCKSVLEEKLNKALENARGFGVA